MSGTQSSISDAIDTIDSVGYLISDIEDLAGKLWKDVQVPDTVYTEDEESTDISVDRIEAESFLQGLDLMHMQDILGKITSLAENVQFEIDEVMRFRNPFLP